MTQQQQPGEALSPGIAPLWSGGGGRPIAIDFSDRCINQVAAARKRRIPAVCRGGAAHAGVVLALAQSLYSALFLYI